MRTRIEFLTVSVHVMQNALLNAIIPSAMLQKTHAMPRYATFAPAFKRGGCVSARRHCKGPASECDEKVP